MKTYSAQKLDELLEGKARTLKTAYTKKGELYLYALNNGEFAVSFDDKNVGIFDNAIDADAYFEQLKQVS